VEALEHISTRDECWQAHGCVQAAASRQRRSLRMSCKRTNTHRDSSIHMGALMATDHHCARRASGWRPRDDNARVADDASTVVSQTPLASKRRTRSEREAARAIVGRQSVTRTVECTPAGKVSSPKSTVGTVANGSVCTSDHASVQQLASLAQLSRLTFANSLPGSASGSMRDDNKGGVQCACTFSTVRYADGLERAERWHV